MAPTLRRASPTLRVPSSAVVPCWELLLLCLTLGLVSQCLDPRTFTTVHPFVRPLISLSSRPSASDRSLFEHLLEGLMASCLVTMPVIMRHNNGALHLHTTVRHWMYAWHLVPAGCALNCRVYKTTPRIFFGSASANPLSLPVCEELPNPRHASLPHHSCSQSAPRSPCILPRLA